MKIVIGAGAILLAAGCVFADASYQEAVRYTGGSLIDMMKSLQNGPMGKMMGSRMGKGLQDQVFKVYVKGNKMARIGTDTSTIFDLDAGTMTTIDNEHQAYTTMTFDEMNQRMQEMKKKMSRGGSQGPDLQFDVKVEETGNTRSINGQEAKEYILTLRAQGEQGAGMRLRSDMWNVSAVPGFEELRNFQKRLSEKMLNAFGGSNPMMGSASAGLSQLTKETMKVKGYPVTQDMAISGVQSPMNPMMGMNHDGAQNSDPNAPFMTMTTEAHGFSDSEVSNAVFEIPAGYKAQHPGRR